MVGRSELQAAKRGARLRGREKHEQVAGVVVVQAVCLVKFAGGCIVDDGRDGRFWHDCS